MNPALIAAPMPAQWAAKNAARRSGVALAVKLAARESVVGGAGGRSVVRAVAFGRDRIECTGGTTSICEVVPKVVL
jgi:hypothetical protein